MRLGMALLSIVLLAGCASGGDKLTPLTIQKDSLGNPQQITGMVNQATAAQIMTGNAVAAENSAYFASQQALYSNPNLDGKDFAIIAMAKALGGGEQMPTNSNDVEIAKVNASVAKHQTWSNVVKFGAGAVVGGYTVGKTVDAFASLAGAAGTVINANGDGNTVDATNNNVDQRADNGSTISDSGNVGIPVNRTDLSLTAANQEIDAGGLSCPVEEGVTYTIRPENPDDDPATVLNGFTCSDGNGTNVLPIE